MNNDITTIVPATRFDLLGPLKIFPKMSFTTITCGNTFCSMDDGFDFIVSTELESRYHYSVMHVGLIYLPQGIACIAGSLVVGNLWIGITDTERQYMTKKLNVYHWTKDHNLISWLLD